MAAPTANPTSMSLKDMSAPAFGAFADLRELQGSNIPSQDHLPAYRKEQDLLSREKAIASHAQYSKTVKSIPAPEGSHHERRNQPAPEDRLHYEFLLLLTPKHRATIDTLNQ
ncbi:hypothetical protein PG985_014785, partial [Apiospora marii]|uniref:uncharacterized protein n=1 Tax=Apiospora marii TaxID=335849 RepID=UPI00312F2429